MLGFLRGLFILWPSSFKLQASSLQGAGFRGLKRVETVERIWRVSGFLGCIGFIGFMGF